jgi:transposase
VPFIHRHNLIFQHDNAQPHVARICTQFLEGENVLQWPVFSPDMSPVEYVWDALDRHAQQYVPVLANIQQLRTTIKEEWDNILQVAINSLINSMRRRCVVLHVQMVIGS